MNGSTSSGKLNPPSSSSGSSLLPGPKISSSLLMDRFFGATERDEIGLMTGSK